jgi:hypothetical protein
MVLISATNPPPRRVFVFQAGLETITASDASFPSLRLLI